jgi:hypothetical protein
MSAYRRRNRMVTFEVEATPGVDAVPILSQAVLTENPSMDNDFQNIDTEEVSAALDTLPSIPAGGSKRATARVYLKGAGVAGQSPDFGEFLQACGMSVRQLVADETGTATAGTARTLTLAAGANTGYQYYRGMVAEITSGAGAGQRRICIHYDNDTRIATFRPAFTVTPNNTSVYKWFANTRFHAQSATLKTGSMYLYEHRSDSGLSKLHKLLGAAGSFTTTRPWTSTSAAPCPRPSMSRTLARRRSRRCVPCRSSTRTSTSARARPRPR